MRGEPVEGIQPAVLRWARETAGLSITEAADALKKPSEEVDAWEKGEGAPTYSQLEKLAYQVYKRPLAVFFLPTPPDELTPKREFRTLPDADLESLARDTHLHIRRAHAYKLALAELFSDRSPADRCIWKSISLSPSKPIAEQAMAIRDFLGVTLESQVGWRNDEQALKQWRKAVEEVGVFVFKAPFKQKEISGFCLIDSEVPIIYLNNSTTKTRQTFSLLHELAHLLLGTNGLSKFGKEYINHLPLTEKRQEQFCNAVAADVLIPATDFTAQTIGLPSDIEKVPEERFAELAGRYGVSREAILRRFLDQGRVSKEFYEAMANHWISQKSKEAGKGNWYFNQGAYLSDRFAKEVVVRHYRNLISLEQAADFLGVKPKSYPGLEEHVLHGAGL